MSLFLKFLSERNARVRKKFLKKIPDTPRSVSMSANYHDTMAGSLSTMNVPGTINTSETLHGHLLREIIEDPTTIFLIDSFIADDIIIEAAENKKSQQKKKSDDMNKIHLDHLEDLLIRDGREGFDTVETILKNTNDFLKGKKNDGFGITTKIDGSPAIVLGHDTKTGEFFVGTKSFFNKAPKINYSDRDITANHGNSKGLSKKLKAALKHLPAVTPKVGIFQGDLVFTHEDKQDRGDGNISFQPNALTYSHPLIDKDKKDKEGKPKPNKEGEKIKKAKIGFAPHTEYKEIGDGEMKATFNNPISKFKKDNPDVYLMDPRMKSGSEKYSTKEQQEYRGHLKKAKELNKQLSDINGYALIKDHEKLILAYINNSVKERGNLSSAGYVSWVEGRFKEKKSALKMKSGKQIKDAMDDGLNDVVSDKRALKLLFDVHKEVSKAKNVLIDALSKGSIYSHSYQGKPSKAEGFVVTQDKRTVKLVDRQHFSAANFEWNSKVNPADNPLVMSWGRMNPPTAGHEQMINTGADIAQRTGAKHQVVATRTSGDAKNPLEPQDKLKHLKTLFPGKNIVLADKNATTIMAQLQHLNNSGVKDLTMVTGADRISDFQNLLHKYNGPGPNKLFDFKRIRVISAGNRDPSAKGVEGTSGTKMRDAASKGDFKSFKKDLPSTASREHSQKIFNDVRKKMSVLSLEKKKKTVPTLQQTVAAAKKEKV